MTHRFIVHVFAAAIAAATLALFGCSPDAAGLVDDEARLASSAGLDAEEPAPPAVASPAAYSLEARVTGQTEDGRGMHDGRRIFFLPVEASWMASPPDLEVCWLDSAGAACFNRRVEGEPVSVCPDRDWCRFDVTLDASDVTGVVVFDIDSEGYGLVRDGAAAVSDVLKGATGVEQQGWLSDLLRAGQAQTEAVATANENRSEWIDAVILAEDRTDPRVRAMSERIRDLVIARAPPGRTIDRNRSRLAGEFLVRHPLDCVSPAPACFLDYSTLQFEPIPETSPEHD